MMRRLILLTFCCLFIFASCKKQDNPANNCAYPAVVPLQPYSNPVWHPNAQLLGFNYTPLSGIGKNGKAPCLWYSYLGKSDSTGFYLLNKNGTGFKRVTTYRLFAPAWSPDGNWLAFSLPDAQIYKLRFTGNDFDTANIVQLTNGGGNFHPSWTANSDTIYYDSNVGTGQGYYIWKMSSDSTGKVGFPKSGREPFVGADDKIYYTGLHAEIFRMEKDGSNQTQVTFKSQFGRNTPKFSQGDLFYNDNSTLRVVKSDHQDLKLTNPAVTYDISTSGEIVYSKMDFGLGYDKQKGTLWIMNSNGTNNRQLTFNNF